MKTPEEAASELWPVIVTGRYGDVVEAFRRRDEEVRAAERERCVQAIVALRDAAAPGSEERLALAGAVLALRPL